ncbi:MAG: helix-turn-helix transcriptional regulator [Solirubrobacterales bacterium]|nr:helix-turn-helix transcriptional regulator [Solirubrobacterales bacterium]
MLDARPVIVTEGLGIYDVACRHGSGRGENVEYASSHALVFVRRGCFVRSADGAEALLDPTLAYCTNPGQEQRYDHPHADGDDCTMVILEPELVASICGGEPELPSTPVATSPRTDLQQRLLVAASRRSPHDEDELFERALALVADALEHAEPARVASGRPATDKTRRALADGARELLAADPDTSLPELARELAVSPHHLSRVFRSICGHSIARHRMRLRARAAAERLIRGDRDLARLAADLGFADQSHLCRVLRSETGTTPSALRHAFASA